MYQLVELIIHHCTRSIWRLTYEHDLHCEAIVNISAPNMWVSYPKLTVFDSSQVTSPKDFDLFTGHFTIEKMK